MMIMMIMMINRAHGNRLPVLRPQTDISCSDKSHTMMMMMMMKINHTNDDDDDDGDEDQDDEDDDGDNDDNDDDDDEDDNVGNDVATKKRNKNTTYMSLRFIEKS